MGLLDIVLLTLLNAIACIVLPRLISLILAHRSNETKLVSSKLRPVASKQKTDVIPYFADSNRVRS